MENALEVISSALAARNYRQETCSKGRTIFGVVDHGSFELPPGTIQFEPANLLSRWLKPTVFLDPKGTLYVERALNFINPVEAGVLAVEPSWYPYKPAEFLEKIDTLCGQPKPQGEPQSRLLKRFHL